MKTKKMTTRDYALENTCFSRKTQSGYWTPHGEFLVVPAKICRYRHQWEKYYGGWRVGYRDENGEHAFKAFSDCHYDRDYKLSLEAAIAWLKQLDHGQLLSAYRRTHQGLEETRKKKSSTGHVGISISQRKLKDGYCLFLLVACGRGTLRRIKVGINETVGSPKYHEKLKEAITLRRLLVEDYKVTHRATIHSGIHQENGHAGT